MIACDSDPSVIAWSSESVVVPYYSPIDQKLHKYYIDFVVRKKLKDGTIEEWLVEVKPSSQIPREDNKPKALEGKITLQKIKRNIKEKETYIINDAKFKAAHKYAEMTGRKFILLTEENF